MRLNNDDKFQDFMTKYVHAISDQITELEKKRYSLLIQEILVIIISVLVVGGLYIKLEIGGVGLYIILLLFPCVFTGYVITEYSKFIKEKVLYKVLNECFNIQLINENPDIRKCKLWSDGGVIERIGDGFQGDWFQLTYKNMVCKVYEIAISSNGKYKEYYFKGLLFQFLNNKKLKGNVIIEPKNQFVFNLLHNNRLMLFAFIVCAVVFIIIFFICGFSYFKQPGSQFFMELVAIVIIIIGLIKSFIDKRRLEVNMGTKEFKKDFIVYSDNISEAQAEVTPYLMQKLHYFKNRFKHKTIKCAFYEDKVVLAVNNGKDLFEIGNLLIPIYKSKTVYKFYRDINMLYDIMDYFFE